MDLIEYEDLMRRLREKRQEVGLQQKAVAHEVGIDPGFLSKMERHFDDANYRTVYRVWGVIEREASSDDETAGELKASPIVWAETDETHREVRGRMREGKFSQLPVRDESGEHVGRITESILMANDDTEQPIEELMADRLIEVPHHMGREAVRGILGDDEPAVLVTEDSEPVGIVTKTDLM
jgi:predicted transcriptional regulator